MDSIPREELERLMFFEQTREKAASDYLRSPTDPDNLTRWGGALLELAHFRQGQDSADMVQENIARMIEKFLSKKVIVLSDCVIWDGNALCLRKYMSKCSYDIEAVSKLEEALRINPRKHDTLWCLGNAHTSQGFLVTETDKANEFFKKAARCFQMALEEEPHNDLYQKALEMTTKAPSLHQELQRQLASQQEITGGGSAGIGGTSKVAKKKKKDNDFKYDVMGWIVLSVGIIAWMSLARTAPQPPPSSLR